MNLFRALLCACFFALYMPLIFAQTVSEKAAADELVLMQDEEPAMRAAFAKARASLDEFLAKAKNPPQNTSGYALKVGISDRGNTEYFWVNEFQELNGKFVGKINNTPRMVRTVRNGQSYEFTKSRIVDWIYINREERRMMGNFTMCALLTKESASAAQAVKAQYGLACD